MDAFKPQREISLMSYSFQGKDLYMDLDTDSLRLIDPQDQAVLNYQPIHTIRVWGVGRENGR